jgi:hypothetical protein
MMTLVTALPQQADDLDGLLENVMIARRRYGRAAATYIALDLARAALPIVPRSWAGVSRGCCAARSRSPPCGLTALWSLRSEFGRSPAPSGQPLRHQLTYALPFQLAASVEIVQAKLHQYVVAHHVDAATFAVYAVYAVGCLDIPIAEFAASAVVSGWLAFRRAAGPVRT